MKKINLSLPEIYQQFTEGMKATTLWEYVAVFTGIASVWFSRIENILVYPVGIVNTVIYIVISIEGQLLGEATVNFYYTVMSIYGWLLWMKKDTAQHQVVNIEFSDKRWWVYQIIFFAVFYLAIFFPLTYLKQSFAPGAIPWADAFASATAFTAMWLMTKKKVESWYWWLATNITSIPLYFVKQYVFTSVYYVVLFFMAIFGLLEWMKRARANTIVKK
ncbi:MAG: nicotinamide mononucleotide transporter [Chitinophagaceae bacterium]|nr:nicotinamide mononucleotide transporter [Chitinophagaceae bacterium]